MASSDGYHEYETGITEAIYNLIAAEGTLPWVLVPGNALPLNKLKFISRQVNKFVSK